jgi:hypothetical protein
MIVTLPLCNGDDTMIVTIIEVEAVAVVAVAVAVAAVVTMSIP